MAPCNVPISRALGGAQSVAARADGHALGHRVGDAEQLGKGGGEDGAHHARNDHGGGGDARGCRPRFSEMAMAMAVVTLLGSRAEVMEEFTAISLHSSSTEPTLVRVPTRQPR